MRLAPRTNRRILLPVAVVAALAAAASGAAALLPDSSAAKSAAAAADGLPHTAVEVSPGACGHGWDRPSAGRQVFDLRNTSSDPAEVYLTDTSTGALLGEVEGLAPGVQRPLQVVLGRGSYAFRCLPEDADAVTGPTVRITAGPATGGPAVLPVTEHDLIPPTLEYQKWIGQGLGALVGKVDALRDAVDSGDLPAARTAWLTAHLGYSRLGAAYDAFGDLGDAVDGLADGQPDGVKDQGFTGFHRIEYGLWHHQSADQLRAPAQQLAEDVRKLRDQWADARMEPADLGLRAHEITEDTVTFELTGHNDYGSGSSLATARAQLDGTAEVLDRLRPLLEPRDPELPGIDQWLARSRSDLDALGHDGSWPAPDKLTDNQRERINADFGGLVERLAGVAAVCDVRRTS
ncbi:EfeM/EfeO family lipoprotein [Peterkaempfera sp. SMS 1(5)a]|uniref:EfeM/EfeO family lipoprotein n=1 Tax=Peterkaempfera podocarpi TaxID=3232308 RepID=UPI00366FE67C